MARAALKLENDHYFSKEGEAMTYTKTGNLWKSIDRSASIRDDYFSLFSK
jgi:hypothetical protein